jgi:hypothetical protein
MSKITETKKMLRQVIRKIKSMFIIFFDMKGVVFQKMHYDNAPSHTSFFTREFLTKNQRDCHPPPTLLFSVSLIEDKTQRPLFLHNLCDQSRIAGSAEYPHRMRLSACIKKITEVLGMVHMCGNGIFRGPVGP